MSQTDLQDDVLLPSDFPSAPPPPAATSPAAALILGVVALILALIAGGLAVLGRPAPLSEAEQQGTQAAFDQLRAGLTELAETTPEPLLDELQRQINTLKQDNLALQARIDLLEGQATAAAQPEAALAAAPEVMQDANLARWMGFVATLTSAALTATPTPIEAAEVEATLEVTTEAGAETASEAGAETEAAPEVSQESAAEVTAELIRVTIIGGPNGVANIRSEPNSDSSILGTVQRGVSLVVIDVQPAAAAVGTPGWFLVRLVNDDGSPVAGVLFEADASSETGYIADISVEGGRPLYDRLAAPPG